MSYGVGRRGIRKYLSYVIAKYFNTSSQT